MSLSYWARVALEAAMIGCAAISSINLYFAIPTTFIGIILLADSITARGSEKADFRKKTPNEALDILDELVSHSICVHISCPVWSSRTEGFKAEVLGARDYALWKQFYDSVEAYNEYFRSREGVSWPDVEKLSLLCFDSFFKVYDGVSWVKESIPEPTIADILSRAKQSPALCYFTRNIHSEP